MKKLKRPRIIVLLVISNLLILDVFAEIIFQKEEIDIYREILHQGRNFTKSQILIHEESTGNTLQNIDRSEQMKLMKELNSQEEIFNDWTDKNTNRQIITESLDLSINHKILTKKDFNLIFKDDDLDVTWDVFSNRYKNTDGFIRLSKPGFDTNREKSIVLVEYHCGPTCGTGRFLSLKKNSSGNWVTENSILMWMAY
tara:strand:+ start:2256 stop:2849 length:594 start_codon:yes stop_codon:yes gene_type:complete